MLLGGKDLGQVFSGCWCFLHSIKESSPQFAKQQGNLNLIRSALSRLMVGHMIGGTQRSLFETSFYEVQMKKKLGCQWV